MAFIQICPRNANKLDGKLRPIPGSDIWVHFHDLPEETRDVRSA